MLYSQDNKFLKELFFFTFVSTYNKDSRIMLVSNSYLQKVKPNELTQLTTKLWNLKSTLQVKNFMVRKDSYLLSAIWQKIGKSRDFSRGKTPSKKSMKKKWESYWCDTIELFLSICFSSDSFCFLLLHKLQSHFII